MTDPTPLLAVRGLAVDYQRPRQAPFRAVDDVSFELGRAETLGLVGESGSGKSTIGKAILGLEPAAAGAIVFDGEDITHCSRRRRRELTREIQVIYQDPRGSLNPVRTIGATLSEPLQATGRRLPSREVQARVTEALDLVGMPSSTAQRLPGEFSGGQRQRIAIARALVVRPRLIVCDEAVSALDLSVQAQVLNLLDDYRSELGLSYLFITHDLAVVRHMAQLVAVLHRGSIVELDRAEVVASSPRHPYTAMLQAAAPVPDPALQRQRRDEFQRTFAAFTALRRTDPVVTTDDAAQAS